MPRQKYDTVAKLYAYLRNSLDSPDTYILSYDESKEFAEKWTRVPHEDLHVIKTSTGTMALRSHQVPPSKFEKLRDWLCEE